MVGAGLPHRGHWLHRVQSGDGRQSDKVDLADPQAPAEYEQNPGAVLQILDEGSKKARSVAQETMGRVREAVFGWDKKRAEISGGPSGAKNAKASD